MRKPTYRRFASGNGAGRAAAPVRVTLSDDQAQVFDCALDWQRRRLSELLTIGGFAGTGKSVLIAELACELRHLRVAFCAFTGKAANGLAQKLRAAGAESPTHSVSTIHSLIYSPEVDEETGAVLRWGRRDELDADLIVVDEASMVNAEMLADLQHYGVPILAVGDHGQLPPVHGEGALMRDPDLRLERIHRQAEGSPIIRLSQKIRECGDLPRGFPKSEFVQVVAVAEAERLLKDLYEREEDVGVLTYTNRSRQQFNRAARRLRFGRLTGRAPETPAYDDCLLCLRNTEHVLFNGMRGVLRSRVEDEGRWWRATVQFPEDALEVEGSLLKSQFGREQTYRSWEEVETDNAGLHVRRWESAGLLFDYGYALTAHKSQGSQFKHAFVLYEKHYRLDADEWRCWLYTAVTRATTHLYVMAS